MNTGLALISHDQCLRHVMGPGHPECPDRLAVIRAALDRLDAPCVRLDAEPADWEYLSLGHAPEYLERLRALSPVEGLIALDPDTAMNPDSLPAARLAAGAVKQAVDGVLAGDFTRAFCAVRPPGHHATRERAMGFCLLNNVALGALHALGQGCARVAIVDFDVHHGNGSQDILLNEPRALVCSSFQYPLYPYSGTETTPPHIVNVPLPEGAGGQELFAALEQHFIPALRAHQPDLLFISAGFDAHAADPLAGMRLSTEDFGELTRRLVGLAEELCGGRIVSSLEGGYDLAALAESASAHVQALAGDQAGGR